MESNQKTPTAAPPALVRQLNRRQFLAQIGGAVALLTVSGAGVSLLWNDDDPPRLAGGTTDETGTPEITPEITAGVDNLGLQPAPGTRPEYTPLADHYLMDISPRPPRIEAADWRLTVTGKLAAPVALTLDELRHNYPPVEQVVTLSCISNPIGGPLIGTTRWTGVALAPLLDEWAIDPTATALKISGADGFFEYVDIGLIRRDERIMLVYAWDGEPLSPEHGFPLRILIPNRYGMKQPKRITTITAVDVAGEGYWVQRGWSPEAIVQATSVIDTVAVTAAFERDGQTYVPIGGMAYAGARGIAKVEVRVDDGEWIEAQLREPLSELTWVIWRYDWPLVAGRQRICVRCVDGQDNRQIEADGNIEADGIRGAATGLDCVVVQP